MDHHKILVNSEVLMRTEESKLLEDKGECHLGA